MEAINDSFFLENAVYILLKKYCKGKPYYVDLMELFQEVENLQFSETAYATL